MGQFKGLKKITTGLALSAIVLTGSAASAFAASASPQQATQPPTRQSASGPQAKAPISAGSKDAKSTEKLGQTNLVKAEADGKPSTSSLSAQTQVGNVSGVDFQTFYNYCWKNLVYTTVNNTTSTTKYIHVMLYNQGGSRDMYATVAAGGSYTYPAFYGVDGAYSAYLYVWNGSSYQYDEYKGGTNTCNVSVTRTYNTGGWVQLKIQNLGTAYATQMSSELAPYPASGTYTGTQYDYPAVGGAALYRWFYVGYSPYGITSSTYGSFNMPSLFSGDL